MAKRSIEPAEGMLLVELVDEPGDPNLRDNQTPLAAQVLAVGAKVKQKAGDAILMQASVTDYATKGMGDGQYFVSSYDVIATMT